MGIDLAAQPADTAVCLIGWGEGSPRIEMLSRGKTDSGTAFHDRWLSTTAWGARREVEGEITKVGIDDPFGWPAPFVDAIQRYAAGPHWPAALDDPLASFRLRETDRVVHGRSGRWPLSVAADRIAIPAMRCAVLLTDIAQHRGKESVARDGSGLCCEVYPDPALRFWTDGGPGALQGGSYKNGRKQDRELNAAKRAALMSAILDQLPIDDPDDRLGLVTQQDDYIDALVCALVARAVELGQTHPPEAGLQAELAAVEGWIHLPDRPLASLGGALAISQP